ncbi:MAG: hypothetical protein AAGM38_01800 [Pseudomonadota bacterium]
MRKILGAACAALFLMGAVSTASAAGCSYGAQDKSEATKDQQTS